MRKLVVTSGILVLLTASAAPAAEKAEFSVTLPERTAEEEVRRLRGRFGEDAVKLPSHVTIEVAPEKAGEVKNALQKSYGEENVHEVEHGAPLGFKADLALWSLVVFLLFVFVLRKFAWGPLKEGLDKREARIRDELARAEDARLRAEKLVAEHEKRLEAVQDEVREIIAEARRDAEHTRNDIIATAQQESETLRQRAVADINRARDGALKELFDTFSAQVAEATEHVLGRAVSDQDQDRLIGEALAQFGGSRA